jgi:branched-chain amino acid transport system permease protein
MAIFPIPLDRIGFIVLLIMAFLVIPLAASEYWISSIMIPFYCFSLAALGLNILTGYAGQVSIGHAAFMAVGAYGSMILYSRYHVPLLPSILGGGVVSAAVGAFFGMPSLRIKGFYLGDFDTRSSVHHPMGPDPLEMGERRCVRHHRCSTSANLRASA